MEKSDPLLERRKRAFTTNTRRIFIIHKNINAETDIQIFISKQEKHVGQTYRVNAHSSQKQTITISR